MGNKIIEYIIRAKDLTASGIKSAIKNVNNFARAARSAATITAAMTTVFSNLGNTTSKAAKAVQTIAMSFMAFGPIGGLIGGVQAAISAFCDKMVEDANRVLDKAQEMADKVKLKLQKAIAQAFKDMSAQVDNFTYSVEYSNRVFNKMVELSGKMYDSDKMNRAAKMQKELLDIETKYAGQADGGGAKAEVELAKKRVELAIENARIEQAHDAKMLEYARRHSNLTRKNLSDLGKARDLAEAEYRRMIDSGVEDEKALEAFKEKRDAVAKLIVEELDKQKDIFAEEENVIEQNKAKQIERENEIHELRNRLMQEEFNARIEGERKIAEEKVKLAQKELTAAQTATNGARERLSAAQANSQQLFGWYSDRDSYRAYLSQQKEQERAEARFQKQFAELSRNEDWRTASYANPIQDLVQKIGLAREEEAAARENYQDMVTYEKEAVEHLSKIEKCLAEGSAE